LISTRWSAGSERPTRVMATLGWKAETSEGHFF
jgi:hypothetical protein